MFQQKRKIYEQIIGFSPEIIVLVSGGTVKETGKNGAIRYRSTKINEGDAFGILWGEARTLAVAELAKYFPKTVIILTGVSNIYKGLKQFSTPQNRIILEKASKNTFSQIGEAMKIIYEKKIKRVVFVTNEYHVPRVYAIYEKIKRSDVQVKFVAAEDVLIHLNKKYIKIIDHMEKSPAYLKRVQNEKRGLSMIKNGKYGTMETPNINKSEQVI